MMMPCFTLKTALWVMSLMSYFCRIFYDWKKERLMEPFWWIWWLYLNFLLRRSCRGWRWCCEVFWVHVEKAEILTKKMRLRRNRKYLVAVMQPFPMMPNLVTHRWDEHLEVLKSRANPFTPTTMGDVWRRGDRCWTTSDLRGLCGWSIVLHTRGAKGDQIIWDYGRKTKTVTWCGKEEA